MFKMGKSIKTVKKLCGAGNYCDINLRDAKMCILLKKIMQFHKGKPRWNVENLYGGRQKAQTSVEVNLLGSDVKLGM